MADVITFKGTTIFDSAGTGAGWKFTPGVMVQQSIDAAPPIGIGYWVKPGNYNTAGHSLELGFYTTSPSGIRAAIQALADSSIGALVLPIWGTINCRLSDVGEFDAQKSDGDFYTVRTTLSFVEYP